MESATSLQTRSAPYLVWFVDTPFRPATAGLAQVLRCWKRGRRRRGAPEREVPMSILYIIGAIVVIVVILRLLGLW